MCTHIQTHTHRTYLYHIMTFFWSRANHMQGQWFHKITMGLKTPIALRHCRHLSVVVEQTIHTLAVMLV